MLNLASNKKNTTQGCPFHPQIILYHKFNHLKQKGINFNVKHTLNHTTPQKIPQNPKPKTQNPKPKTTISTQNINKQKAPNSKQYLATNGKETRKQ
jgi:hypothetical protein